MAAIEFVVRDSAGIIQRGALGGEGISSALMVGSGADISLNLRPDQVVSYIREGGALKVTLVDGQVIYIDNFFAPGGSPQADLFLSSNGELAEVTLVAGQGGLYYANYVAEDVAGKWSPSDPLIFMGREAPELAGVPADDEAGMLAVGFGAAPFLLPLLGLAGIAAATGGDDKDVLDDDDERDLPDGKILSGTKDTGDVVNEEDHADGVDITGTGTPGATVIVIIDGVTETTVIGEDGTWGVVFDPEDIDTGTYETPVKVIIRDEEENLEVVIDDTLVVDTEVSVTFDEDRVGGDGMVNMVEEDGGVTLTGTVEAGATVMVTIEGMSFEATVTGTSWSLFLPAGTLAQGEYLQDVTVEATDQYGNTREISGDFAVDTEIDLTVNAKSVEGNGIVNAAERSDGVIITGTSDAGATVTVQMNGFTHTATADAQGRWQVNFAASEVAAGTYTAPVKVTAEDAAGNQTTVNTSIKIDTEARVAIAGPVEVDDTINAAEASDGVVLTGTTEPGSVVMVTFGSMTLAATVTATGAWSVTFPASAVEPGTYETVIVANAIDANGNSATASKTVNVDTETFVTVRTANVEGDGTINFVERADGVTLTGTAEAGAKVEVTFAGVTRTVTAGANGQWSANYTAAQIPSGETTAAVSVKATDLAGNTATTTGTVTIDTFVNRLEITAGPGGADGIINQTESGQPIVIGGMVERGSTVTVTLEGVTRTATVAADGSWTVTFPPGTVPGGEYDSTVTVNATDRAGNTSSISQKVRVDTVAGDVTLSPDPIEIDDTVNFVERSDGVLIHGTATPGLTVTVTLGGVAHQVVAGADGYWESLYTSAEIPAGTYVSQISASITDSAGNTKTVTDSVNIDTEIFLTLTKPIEGDNVVNAAEAVDGMQLTGTVEPGSRVTVTYGSTAYNATVAANGTWTLTIPASAIASGEYSANFSATATDRAGNTTSITDSVRIDTIVNRLDMSRPVEGDNIINRIEAQDGVTLTGMVEQGSTVVVTFEGTTRTATVAANGSWSVNFAASEIPPGDYDAKVTVRATDSVGNTRSINETIAVDTTPPEAPLVESATREDTGLRRFTTSITDDTVDIHQVAGNGTVSDATYVARPDPDFPDEIDYVFTAPIPNGSHLVITSSDDAGNNTSTLFVLEEALTNAVDVRNAGLDGFNIEAIDLQFAEDSQLTLTTADLQALSQASNTLTVHGGVDDTVTIMGAKDSLETQEIGGRTYKVWDFGPNGGSVIIDEDITVVH
jgi:hypothetical protein